MEPWNKMDESELRSQLIVRVHSPAMAYLGSALTSLSLFPQAEWRSGHFCGRGDNALGTRGQAAA